MAVGLAMIVHRAVFSPSGRMIFDSPAAPWITAPMGFSARTRQYGRKYAPVTRFRHEFEWQADGGAGLEIRAFGRVRLLLNGEPVKLMVEPPNWKWSQRVALGARLRTGRNTILVEVRNLHGPGLLSIRLDGPGGAVRSGEHWEAAINRGEWSNAWLADDRRPHPDSARFVQTKDAFATHWPWLLLLFVLGLGVVRVPGLIRDPSRRAQLGMAAAGLVLCLRIFLLFERIWPLPTAYGFDATKHLDTIDFIAAEGRMPGPKDGWSSYHPPLYHSLGALLFSIGRPLGLPLANALLKLVSFFAGLLIVLQSVRLARRLLGHEGSGLWAAGALAAVLPMNVYMAAYVSNESLAALFSAGALVSGVDFLRADRPSMAALSRTSVWLGLALLTKFTALVLAAAFLPMAIGRLAADRRAGSVPMVTGLVAALGPMLVLAGWFYGRSWLLHGSPVVGNWSIDEPGLVWWSPPGFHTPAYYMHFGAVLVAPYYSAFSSFWDALYSTLWGDGLLAGSAEVSGRNPLWSYEWMALGYWLALPISALSALGLGALLHDAWSHRSAGRRRAVGFMLLFGAMLLFAMLYTTLALPYFGQAKAFYALSASPILCVGFGRGHAVVDGWLAEGPLGRLRPVLHALVFAALATLIAGFIA